MQWIIAKGCQFPRVAHDVVVGLVHPKRGFGSEQLVASVRADAFDSSQQRRQIVTIRWGEHRMDVVRHQHKRIDIVALAIEVQQAKLDLGPYIWLSQVAGAHTGIQPFLHSAAEPLFIFSLLSRQPRLRMPSQPDRTLISPLKQERLRQ